MSYEEMKIEIKNAPMSYLPGLLVCVVKTIYEKKALKPGGAARIAKSVEYEHAESAGSAPNEKLTQDARP